MNHDNALHNPARIRRELLAYAKTCGQDFQRTIDSYAIECLLDRLAHSRYAARFVLKGALLYAVWKGPGKRSTRDVDLLGRSPYSPEAVLPVFKEVVSAQNDYDGVLFSPNQIEEHPIKEGDVYEGSRVFVPGALSGARFKVYVDIAFGDAVTPAPVSAEFPRILNMKPFSLLMYPPESVFAEKLEAIVSRGLINSRMKDYYDLSFLIRNRLMDTRFVKAAIEKTFQRRKTTLPRVCPPGLSREFAFDRTKNAQWKAFVERSLLQAEHLPEVVRTIHEYTQETIGLKW